MHLPGPFSRSRVLLAIATSVALAGIASACAPQDGDTTASPQPVSGGFSAVKEPPVQLGSQDPADPATWVVSNGAVGDLRLGDRLDEALAGSALGWSTGDCAAAWAGGAGFEIAVSGDRGEIDAIAVNGEVGDPAVAPRTPEGLGLGSTRDEVRAVYPGIAETPADGDAVTLRPDGADITGAELAFEVSGDGRVTSVTLAAEGAALPPGC